MKYAWLPPTLRDIADVAGLDAALALADARGGERVYLPAEAHEGHWLPELVGLEAAAAICEFYRGGVEGAKIDIPAGPAGGLRKKAARIREMIDAGCTSNEIVREVGVVFRTVTRHRAKAREEQASRQGRLF